MSHTAPPSRAKTALVIVLILLPLVLTVIVKYLPSVTEHQKISSVAILHPRLYVPKERVEELNEDVLKRLRAELEGTPGIQLTESPSGDVTHVGDDLAKAARSVGAGALIVPTLTIDGGLVQLNLQIIDPASKKILYNTPYQSSLDRYPDMMKAAGDGLKRALQ